jgi:hypothetical protein
MAFNSEADHIENILAGYLTSPITKDLGWLINFVISLSVTIAYIF